MKNVFAYISLLLFASESFLKASAFRTLYSLNNGAFKFPRARRSKLAQRSEYSGDILVYNTLNRRKEKFESITSNKVSFYSCGPTVYDYAHVGNFRAFLTYDLIKRWLQYCGYTVDHVCNLTDVDDKIIIKMMAENMSLQEVTNKYTTAFFEDLDVLNIIRARAYPKATEHIQDIENMVQQLIDNGNAYLENGSVYFRVSSFPQYGQLANLKADSIRDGSGEFGPNERRGTTEKESSRDFALWKAFTEQDGEVVWEAPFGKGRPGWHIECSAMCHRLLGPTIDIHAGGVDLVFPHHQNEVAQSEALTGKAFSKYWMHNGFVNINNEKMSKSLKNFKTLRDIVSSTFDARAFRYMVVTAQYRQPLNFNPETLKAAANSLKRIDKAVQRLKQVAADPDIVGVTISLSHDDAQKAIADFRAECENTAKAAPAVATSDAATSATADSALQLVSSQMLLDTIADSIRDFEVALSDDLNTPKAVAALFKLVGAAEKALKGVEISTAAAQSVLGAIQRMDSVFGVLYKVPDSYIAQKQQLASIGSSAHGWVNAVVEVVGGGGGGAADRGVGLRSSGAAESTANVEQRLRHLLGKASGDTVCTCNFVDGVHSEFDHTLNEQNVYPATRDQSSASTSTRLASAASESASTAADTATDTAADSIAASTAGLVAGEADEEMKTRVIRALGQVKELARQRAACKAAKQFAKADALRQQVNALGFGLKDVKGGYEIYVL